MAHDCPNCGRTFETVSDFAEHGCMTGDDLGEDAEQPERELPELERSLESAKNGDVNALHDAISTYNERLATLRENDTPAYTDLFREYYEPLANCLDEHVQERGWSLLSEFTSKYAPRTDTEGAPEASAVVENAVGRLVIRTRFLENVDAVPVGALEYLRAFGVDDSAASEESFVYGWGIGHSDHPVAEHLHSMATDHYLWVGQALEQAFYADQRSATDLLERLVMDDEIQFTWPPDPDEGVDSQRFFLAIVADLDGDGDEYLPRFYDWRSEFGYTFEWEQTTQERVRQFVVECGLADELPDEWTLADLGI